MPSPPSFAQEQSQLVNRQKRRGVALSCAECRRLKLKCSRQFPCSNCVKKGCSAICPDGSLTTGKGNRFVLANTETLHEKINVLANRVRHLEDALSQSHALNSHDTHPLLSEDLLQLKRPLERERADGGLGIEERPEAAEAVHALGSLAISESGRSTFFGTTANSWFLLQIEEGSDEDGPSSSPFQAPNLPQDLPWLSQGFPFTSVVDKAAEAVQTSVMAEIPSIEVAKRTCNLYFRHAAWMYHPISEKDFYETIYQSVYPLDEEFHEPLSGHGLSVFFGVLALGALLDLDLPAHSSDAMQYYQVARAALSLESVLEQQTILGIQALLLMCHFMFLSDMGGPRWVMMGIVVKMAQSIGLHRDSGKWKLGAEETQKRRELFYEILTYDSWQSLTFGRPPSLAAAHVDCKLPQSTTTTVNGEVELTFAAWKHKFCAECLSVVHDQVFGTRRPTYATIQELDKKVREWYVPPSLMVPGFGNAKIGAEVEQPSIELTMQRYTGFAIKEITLFYMHRGFFAQAIEDNTTDPMGSKYASSVFAAHRSAMTFVALIESLYKQHPQLTERMWFLFTHVFSCAIVLGSIAVKSRMPLARGALDYLDLACHLFSQVTDTARTGKILPILMKLKERAHAALASAQSSSDLSSRTPFLGGPSIKTEEDSNECSELSALGGMTRLVARRNTPSSPSYSGSSPSSPKLNSTSSPSRLTSQTSSIGPTPSSSSSSNYNAPMTDVASSWHSHYTHIQNVSVNINVGEYGPYPAAGPSTSSSSTSSLAHACQPTPEMGFGYASNPEAPIPIGSPQAQQQRQHQQQQAQYHHQQMQQTQHLSLHQQHHPQHLSPMDATMGEFYGFSPPNIHMQQQDLNPQMNDLDYPWHNLMSQFRP